jgi:hypothetical protein
VKTSQANTQLANDLCTHSGQQVNVYVTILVHMEK